MSTVFYSWQSDRPNRSTRGFIQDALKKAIKAANRDLTIDPPDRGDEAFTIDHDTKGEPGTPDIVATILRKIDDCAIFVADLTYVAETEDGKGVPNPNVLIERGYALNEIGSKRMIGVMNEAYGAADRLPFDLRGVRWPICYRLAEDTNEEERRRAKAGLIDDLKRAIKEIVLSGVLASPVVSTVKWRLQPKSRVSSFFDEGDVLCEMGRAIHNRDQYWDVTWQDGPQMFLRVVPERPAKQRNAGELLEILNNQSGTPLWLLSGHSSLWWQGNEFGAVIFLAHEEESKQTAYNVVQITEHGEIWAIDGSSLRDDRKVIPWCEDRLVDRLGQYLRFAQEQLGVKPPVRVIAGLSGVKSYALMKPPPPPNEIWLDPIEGRCVKSDVYDEATVADMSQPTRQILMPLFDKIWGSCQLTRPDWLPKD